MSHRRTHEDVMKEKNRMHIAAHEAAYGAKLGELKVEPTQAQLDKALEEFKAEKYDFPKATARQPAGKARSARTEKQKERP